MRRVAVTGIGVVSSIGTGAAAFEEALRAGRSGAGPITAFDTEGFAHTTGCEVTDFDPARWVRTLPPREVGRATQFAITPPASPWPTRVWTNETSPTATVWCRSAPPTAARTTARRWRRPRCGSGSVRSTPPRCAAFPRTESPWEWRGNSALAMWTSPPSRNYVIGNGFDAVRSGEADFALCGGADAMCRMTFTGFYRLKAIDPQRCRPFDTRRKGILTGEGAAVLLLEPWDSAVARGARIYAEVLGYGLNCDAHHQVAPERGSVARCMSAALQDAGVTPGDVVESAVGRFRRKRPTGTALLRSTGY